MIEDDRRRSLSVDDVEVLAACLRGAADGPFFPDWEFSTLFGFERVEVGPVAAPWLETPDTDHEYGVLSSVVNNLLGYPPQRGRDFLGLSVVDCTNTGRTVSALAST